MNERTRKRIVYATFIGAVIFGLLMRPWERHRRSDVTTTTESVAATMAPAVVPPDRAAIDTGIVLDRCAFAPTWPRDPFRGRVDLTGTSTSVIAVETRQAEPGLVLQGVMTVEGRRVCVINGRVGQVGSVIDGWRVLRIDETQVVLVRGQETLRLDLS
ncbi:MAG: hypothetical protein AB1792_10255 [Candidatus Zixiibacteriota bacterium]